MAKSTTPDEDFKLNQNLSIIIISLAKIILIEYFCIQKMIEVETRWKINKPSNIFSFFFTLYIYIYIYIYIYESKYGLKSDSMKVIQKS